MYSLLDRLQDHGRHHYDKRRSGTNVCNPTQFRKSATPLIILTIIAPLIAALIAIFLSRPLGRLTGPLCAIFPALGFAYYFNTLLKLESDSAALICAFPWAPAVNLTLAFRMDGLSIAFGLLISGIGALICLYADTYFRGDPRRDRFLAFLFFFMSAMLGVVFSDNLIVLFVFWELTGVASFLLIGFEHGKERARNAALQALLTTGAGGLALLAGFILLGNAAGSYLLTDIIATPSLSTHPHYLAILLLVLAGAATKSAQFPFHFWLPNAMAAPTPASAYLHSSTMVKAGIYLLARLSPALGDTELWFWLLTGMGGATMLVGGWLAIQQNTLKPMLAYSTICALGMLVLCLGLGTPMAIKAFKVFLFVHAFYKAALFMIAGAVIKSTGETGVEALGGLGRAMPFTATAAFFAALSMAGLPPLVGFIGKESVYEAVLHSPRATNYFVIAAVLANVSNVYVAAMVGLVPFWRRRGGEHLNGRDGAWGLVAGPLLLGLLGLLAGLYPAFLGQHILDPGTTTVLGEDIAMKLKLWHGLNLALLLSLVTLALGLTLLVFRNPWHGLTGPLNGLARFGPEALYHGTVAAILQGARVLTRIIQHGYLRYYLLVVLVCMTAAMAGTLQLEVRPDAFESVPVRAHELITVAVIALAALALTRMRSRFGALACLGVIGYGMALLYVYYGAPDLAKTQIVVESLAVVFFALLAAAMPGFREITTRAVRRRDGLIAAVAGCLMGVLVYSTLASNQTQPVANYYRDHSLALAHGKNIVNVILVDFRALDTLGEITVLAVAAFGARALLRKPDPGEESR